MRAQERGGYSAGDRTVDELPPPPLSVSVGERRPETMTLGAFRELTADVPDEWPIFLQVRHEDNDFTLAPTDGSVDVTNRTVEILDDTHVRRPMRPS